MLTKSDQDTLRQVAWNSIRYGLGHEQKLDHVDKTSCPALLIQPGASFVSLHINAELRGCVGSLQATKALIDDVNHNANAAAFTDPRFAALQELEFDHLSLNISVLQPATDMQFSSEQDLLNQLLPKIDGLVFTQGRHCATFLPVVWEQLPEPSMFLNNLKQKAGLTAQYWSETIKISRYTTISF